MNHFDNDAIDSFAGATTRVQDLEPNAVKLLDHAADLVSSRGNLLTLEEVCARLGISAGQVRARVGALARSTKADAVLPDKTQPLVSAQDSDS